VKYSWINIRNEDFTKLRKKCPAGNYIVVSPEEAKELVPCLSDAHLAKADSVFIMCSGTTSGISYYMANINRIDNGTVMIDQDPLGFGICDHQPYPSGCYIQHGNWMGRTIAPPEGFSEYITGSGLGNCYPLPTMPPNTSGNIEEINNSSQQHAFRKLIDKITVVFPEKE
jgi:hypothetical protein